MIVWILQPLTAVAYWSDSNGDGVREEHADPTDPQDTWWETDSDGDLMTNSEEVQFGSDPYRLDSDSDGLTDRDERDLSSTDPWLWDSNSDGYSDHDAYYNCFNVDYAALQMQGYAWQTVYDADGDGAHNQDDSYPLDRDNDGLEDWNDAWPDDPSNIEPDSDGDGIGDSVDMYPNDYWNGSGPGDDDGDGITNDQDPYPNDPWNGYGYEDPDGDGIPNSEDLYPYDPWNGGSEPDSDGDGMVDSSDPYPDDSWNGNGSGDDDGDGIQNDADSYPYDPSNGNTNLDSDGDGTPDSSDPYPYDPLNGSGESDSDGDGWMDSSDPYPDDYWNGNGSGDEDGDGIPNDADTFPYDPTNGGPADTDGDGLNDDEEVIIGTDPGNVDSDSDGLSDLEETQVFRAAYPSIDPNNPRSLHAQYDDWYMVDQTDTDTDGIPDRIEVFFGMDINDALDAGGDLDGDAVTNLQAWYLGWSLTANLNQYDADGDGITDAQEDAWSVMYPGILNRAVFEDSVEDFDGDGLFNFEEIELGADPGNKHSWYPDIEDGQLMTWQRMVAEAEAAELAQPGSSGVSPEFLVQGDANEDGVPDGYAAWGTPSPGMRFPGDEDQDGMSNVWEHRHRLNLRHHEDAGPSIGLVPPLPPEPQPEEFTDASSGYFDEYSYATAITGWQAEIAYLTRYDTDPDRDGLSNLREFQLESHPRLPDSDGDGVTDGGEAEAGTGVNDPDSEPAPGGGSGGDDGSGGNDGSGGDSGSGGDNGSGGGDGSGGDDGDEDQEAEQAYEIGLQSRGRGVMTFVEEVGGVPGEPNSADKTYRAYLDGDSTQEPLWESGPHNVFAQGTNQVPPQELADGAAVVNATLANVELPQWGNYNDHTAVSLSTSGSAFAEAMPDWGVNADRSEYRLVRRLLEGEVAPTDAAGNPIKPEIRRTYLKVTEKTPDPDDEYPVTEAIELVIPAGEDVSSSSVVLFPETPGHGSCHIRLLPLGIAIHPGSENGQAGATSDEYTFEVSADDPITKITLALNFTSAVEESENPDPYAAGDGTEVEWEIVEGSGNASLSAYQTVLSDGTGVAQVDLVWTEAARASAREGETDGAKCRVKAVIKKLMLPTGDLLFEGEDELEIQTSVLEVIPGKAHEITVEPAPENYPADGTSEMEVTITAVDQFENLVRDGSKVRWTLKGLGAIYAERTELTTTGGIAKALITSGVIGPQELRIQIDECIESHLIEPAPISITLSSSSPSLDIATSESCTLTATFSSGAGSPADGTRVTWFTSSGSIVGQSVVDGGSTTATLSAANGREGSTLISVGIGNAVAASRIQFENSGPIGLSLEHPVIVGDELPNAEGAGTVPLEQRNGSTYDVPYYTKSKVTVRGTPNALVVVGADALLPVVRYSFDNAASYLDDSVSDVTAVAQEVNRSEFEQAAGIASLEFAGTSTLTIPHQQDFSHEEFRTSIQMKVTELPSEEIRILEKPGEYALFLQPGGDVRAELEHGDGTTSLTASRKLVAGEWAKIVFGTSSDALHLEVDGSSSASPISASRLQGTSAVQLGGGFIGFVDEVSISVHQGDGGLIAFTGLGAGQTIQLDEQGQGEFFVESTGQLLGGNQVAETVPIVVSDGTSTASAPLVVAEKVGWAYVWNAVKGFAWGEEENVEGMAGDIASGMLIYGDVRDICKNLFYLVPGGSEPNWVDFGFASAGLLTEFAVGVGEVPDFFITVSKKILKIVPVDSPLAKALVETIKNFGIKVYTEGFMSGIRYLEAPGRFMVAICGLKTSDLGDISAAINRISDFPARISLLKNLIKSTDDFFAFGKLCAKFGDKGVDVLDSLRRLAENTAEYGAEAAECALRALADVADESVVIDALKASDKLDECIEGLAIVAKSGLGPADIAAVLKNHANILSAAYTSEKLLLDVKVLGKIPGMDHLWKMLKTNSTNTKGFRYELEGAAWLRRSGNNVAELSTDVSVALQAGVKSVNTDIDVVVLLNNKRIYYQFKRSRDALRDGKKGLDNAKLWVSKAFKDLGAGATFDQIKYAVPPGVSIPPQISAFLNSLIPPIKVERIPHLE